MTTWLGPDLNERHPGSKLASLGARRIQECASVRILDVEVKPVLQILTVVVVANCKSSGRAFHKRPLDEIARRLVPPA